jgi:hypothetical protein
MKRRGIENRLQMTDVRSAFPSFPLVPVERVAETFLFGIDFSLNIRAILPSEEIPPGELAWKSWI